MTAPAAKARVSGSGYSCGQSAPAAGPVSKSDLMGQHLRHAVPLARRSARGIDAREFRAWFAPKFAEWLQDRYRTPEHVAVEFGVRVSTAWNWWNGDNRASGDTVALAFITFPDAAAWFLAEWRRR